MTFETDSKSPSEKFMCLNLAYPVNAHDRYM